MEPLEEGEDFNEAQLEEEDNLAYLPADHPLLRRVQVAITKQLTQEHERVDLELADKEEKYKQLERSKEDVGVHLYTVQQQLAQYQMKFEQGNENFALVQKYRSECEEKFASLNEIFLKKKFEVEDMMKKYIKSQDELSKLNRAIKQAESFNVKMKSEISVTKRTTYRAEENIVNLEKEKLTQDFYIDSLNEEIKNLNEKSIILTAQLISQKEEKGQAQKTLQEAQIEIEKILNSKRNLLELWQKNLFKMQRADNGLQAVKEATKQQLEVNVQIKTEINGVTNEIRKEEDLASKYAYRNRVLEEERRFLENERKKLNHRKDKLIAQMTMLKKSLQSTEVENKNMDGEIKGIEGQMTQIETNIMKLHTERKKIFENLINNVSEHKTIEKTAANLNKQANHLGIEIEDKEVELEEILNEISRVNLDIMNSKSQIEMLESIRKEKMKEREEKEIAVATYEVQIRQGHDLNEKKQHEVGRLNKLHDDWVQNSSEMNKGPLEAKRNNLLREIEDKKKDLEDKKGDWIKKQTSLVDQSNLLLTLEGEVNQLKTEKTIREQKKHRLNATYQRYEKDIKEIQNSLKNIQTEMKRLNDKLALNLDSKTKFENENYNIESEFIEKLKQMEKEAARLELDIDKLRENKSNLLEEIIECERQILLWERKIQLEKEMQEALNPNIGQKELEDLKKVVHRKELDIDEIRKQQERIILEMERSVYKRDTIQIKYINKDKKTEKGKVTPSNVQKEVQKLKTTLSQTNNNNKQLEAALRQKYIEFENLNAQIEATKDAYNRIEADLHDQTMKYSEAKLQKLLNVYDISKLQMMAKKYSELIAKTARPAYPEPQLRAKIEETLAENQKYMEIFEKAIEENPEFGFLIQKVMNLN